LGNAALFFLGRCDDDTHITIALRDDALRYFALTHGSSVCLTDNFVVALGEQLDGPRVDRIATMHMSERQQTFGRRDNVLNAER
jgi:hypothetical protein